MAQPSHEAEPDNKSSYISPSDTIMSPTTKKLSEMKGKRFASAKPQSLFAKTVGKQAEAKGLGTPAQDDGGEEGDGKA